jgi:hypothetical protein
MFAMALGGVCLETIVDSTAAATTGALTKGGGRPAGERAKRWLAEFEKQESKDSSATKQTLYERVAQADVEAGFPDIDPATIGRSISRSKKRDDKRGE